MVASSAAALGKEAASLRRLVVACEKRIPSACQAMANEQSFLGRLLYKNKRQHRRHVHLTQLAGTFKDVDLLLDRCDITHLQKLLAACLPSESSRTSDGAAAEEQLRTALLGVAKCSASLRSRAQAACAVLRPLLLKGFFVPFALGACATLGRVFELAGEIQEAALTGDGVLTRASAAGDAPSHETSIVPTEVKAAVTSQDALPEAI
eukprot:gnl/TRDRNA2_/TRDRNA2_88658_c0_seq2.p1 gnl/TRDRNA2_/TRDRNA2_88658_c0~~gnl/TRDRNA2_/TRDRNA2_88658_c0_seq2.p1  ORF type:complete len:223 (-),score=45.26 gnl/TRDRNA2_/TRDRNA2_88658_c0_seq2:27-647(-)